MSRPIQQTAHDTARPGMAPLLSLLRDADSGAGTLPDEAWEHVLLLAEEHHLLPLVVARLLRREIGTALRQRLLTMQREAAIDSFYLCAELKRLMQAFEAADLLMVSLKGPFLGARLLGDAALRQSYDLDLLVRKEELARAEELLAGMGFARGTEDDYHCQWHRGGTTLELHHDVDNPLTFEFSTLNVLMRVERTAFEEQGCFRLAPDDELYYLCLHAVRHRFERLSIVFDLCLAFEKLRGCEPVASGSGSERERLLCLGLAMARRLRPDLRCDQTRASSGVERHMSRVADRLWTGLLTRASEPLDWHALHLFYVEIESSGGRMGRRWKHLQIALGRLIEPDVEFAAKLGLRRRWQARVLRPVRLLRDKALARRARDR